MPGARADASERAREAASPNRSEYATLGGNTEGADRPIAAADRCEAHCMLLPLDGRRLYYDLAGPESGPVVCLTHSLSSDSGIWAEQGTPPSANKRIAALVPGARYEEIERRAISRMSSTRRCSTAS
jgi:hypothetical protein